MRLYFHSLDDQVFIDKVADYYSLYIPLPKFVKKATLVITVSGETTATTLVPVEPMTVMVGYGFKKQELPQPSPDGKITVQVKFE